MTIESVVWDEWYPVAIAEDVTPCKVYKTRLLGHSIEYACDADGRVTAWHGNAERTPCKALTRYHTHWVSLGDPPERFFALPEFDEPDRRTLGGGSMTVHVSGLRAIENFLDMAHFPYVHDGFLGAEPYTDVLPYDVSIEPPGEIFARNCRFSSPGARPRPMTVATTPTTSTASRAPTSPCCTRVRRIIRAAWTSLACSSSR